MTSEPQGTDSAGGATTILIVEDEESIRKLMSRMLQIQGYQTLEACDGVEALGLCEEYDGNINLIVTDIVMPKLTGKQLVQELRKNRQSFKVIFMSGYTGEEMMNGEDLGVEVAFIPKPFTAEVLAQKVKEVLDR